MKNHREWMGKDEEGNKNGIDLSIRETMKIICSFSIGIKYTNEWMSTEAEERKEQDRNCNNFFILDKSGLLYTFLK